MKGTNMQIPKVEGRRNWEIGIGTCTVYKRDTDENCRTAQGTQLGALR